MQNFVVKYPVISDKLSFISGMIFLVHVNVKQFLIMQQLKVSLFAL